MPFDPGGGGGGIGGGSGNICNVSPSDQIGQISNILNRLQNVEAALAAILGTNVEAVQLSDISNDLGWIYNVTYLGQEGWTQTPSGTLIPPAGWTGLSSVIDGLQGSISIGGASLSIKQVRSYYLSDISSGSSVYIHPDTELSTYINQGSTGLTAGTVNGSKTGWISSTAQGYLVIMYVSITAGTSSPSSGWVDAVILRSRVSTAINTYIAFQSHEWDPGYSSGGPGGANGFTVIGTGVLSSAVQEGWTFRILNNTNGDIQIEEIVVTFIKM